MKTMLRVGPVFFAILVVISCCASGLAQPASEAITLADMKSFIAKSKDSGEIWPAADERYVLDNFNRSQLVLIINGWQERNRTELTKDVKITILIDYLLTELKGMRALTSVLDAASEGKSASFAKQLKTQVGVGVLREYQFARIKIEVNLASVDVQIDGKVFSQKRNGSMFAVAPERPHVVIITNGADKCSNTITERAGRIALIPCTLR